MPDDHGNEVKCSCGTGLNLSFKADRYSITKVLGNGVTLARRHQLIVVYDSTYQSMNQYKLDMMRYNCMTIAKHEALHQGHHSILLLLPSIFRSQRLTRGQWHPTSCQENFHPSPANLRLIGRRSYSCSQELYWLTLTDWVLPYINGSTTFLSNYNLLKQSSLKLVSCTGIGFTSY